MKKSSILRVLLVLSTKGLGSEVADFTSQSDSSVCKPVGSHINTAKKIYADYHAMYATPECDGSWEQWKLSITARQSQAEKTSFNYNPDLIGPDGRHQIASVLYPMTGPQSDLDPDYLEYQILQAKTVHIDGFTVEWGFPEHRSNKAALKMMEIAKKHNFKVGLLMCPNWLWSWIEKYRPDCNTHEKKLVVFREAIQYQLDTFFNIETGIFANQHPLIMLFGGERDATPDEFREIKAHPFKTPAGVEEPLYIRAMGVGATNLEQVRRDYEKWGKLVDGVYAWISHRPRNAASPPLYLKTHDMYAVSEDTVKYQKCLLEANEEFCRKGIFKIITSSAVPGMDNRPSGGWGGKLKYIDWENGDTYRKQWQFNVASRSMVDMVFVNTWNDFSEATVVQPTFDFGFREMETTEHYAAEFKGIPSDPSGIKLPLQLFELRKKEDFFKRTGFDTVGLIDVLDKIAEAIGSGKYIQAKALLTTAKEQSENMESLICAEKFITCFPSEKIKSIGSLLESDGVYKLNNGLYLRFEEALSEKLRTHNFEAFLEFEYLDTGREDFMVLTSSPRPDSKDSRYSEVCRIRKDGPDGWVKAKVKLHKVNSAFTHDAQNGSDFIFKGNGQVKNISFSFETLRLK